MQYSAAVINSVAAFLIFVLGLVIGQIVGNVLKRVLKGIEINKILEEQLKLKLPLEEYLASVVKYVIYFVAFIFAINQLGLPTRTLKILLVVIIISIVLFIVLAFKDWIPNLVSGFYLAKTQKIKMGDTIQIKGVKGKVIGMSLLETKVETEHEEIIFIPNSLISKHELVKAKTRERTKGGK